MWILGFAIYYLFHRIAFVYYLGIFAKGEMQRPVASMYRWFHIAVPTVAAVFFLGSCFFFYLSAPWLTIAPVFLLGVSWFVVRVKHGSRTDGIIKRATEVQVRMEREGHPQTEINKAIYLGATGKLYPFESDFDLKSFLRYTVLREVTGFDTTEDLMYSIEKGDDSIGGSISDKIDAAVDGFYRYWCDRYDAVEPMKR
jgi:hypothetical protein